MVRKMEREPPPRNFRPFWRFLLFLALVTLGIAGAALLTALALAT